MRILGLLLSFALALACVTAQAATLDTIKQRGTVNCGTAPNLPGFAYTDDKNVRRGFDVDLCRALAAAVLGDADKVQLSPLNLRDGFATLTTGGVDVLTHRLTSTYNLIGLVEFLAVLQIAFADPAWLIGDQVRSTGYLFAALIFWLLCSGLSRYSARFDRRMRAA